MAPDEGVVIVISKRAVFNLADYFKEMGSGYEEGHDAVEATQHQARHPINARVDMHEGGLRYTVSRCYHKELEDNEGDNVDYRNADCSSAC